MDSTAAKLHLISKCNIKPQLTLEPSQKICHLTPWDHSLLSLDYLQTGLLFTKPQHIPIETIINQLKDSLSTALIHFFPLLGRLVTETTLIPPSSIISLDCEAGDGAEFIHAAMDVTIADILSPKFVPSSLVELLFALDDHRPVGHDGHTLPLLAVQITELCDGIFVGCSFNHVIGDGNSFWHFFNCWSEISRTKELITRPPITKRWFIEGQSEIIKLPYTHPSEFINKYVCTKPLLERYFHFTAQSVAKLKAKANADLNTNKSNISISSYRAVAALVWRAVTRARGFSPDSLTMSIIVIDDRARLDPPLSMDYLGNCVLVIAANTTSGELLSNNLGWAAMKLHEEIVGHTDEKIRSVLEGYPQAPFVNRYSELIVEGLIGNSMSPRYDVYGNDFGWGKPVAVRSGHGGKFDGLVTWSPGSEGGGSMDLEICLSSNTMYMLEEDDEFMDAVSPAPMP